MELGATACESPYGSFETRRACCYTSHGKQTRKVSKFLFFFGEMKEEAKELRIFSHSPMSCEFDLMHLEITDSLVFHWWMMEIS